MLGTLALSPAAFAKSHKKTSSHKAPVIHGQRSIDNDRAREIQTALIREKYLDGEPTGQWDDATEAAMQKFQADNGWQTKLMPDSRALIKLGLGPQATDKTSATTENGNTGSRGVVSSVAASGTESSPQSAQVTSFVAGNRTQAQARE